MAEAPPAFKAGMLQHGGPAGTPPKIRMVADRRRGELKLAKSADGLQHLAWKDRGSGRTEHDFVVFPGDSTLKRIRTPDAKDRVYEACSSSTRLVKRLLTDAGKYTLVSYLCTLWRLLETAACFAHSSLSRLRATSCISGGKRRTPLWR